ncbi:MAG: FHA domain-containing protein, partial [Candidatus Sumerlaeaceae bacterium]|nr:FHA domain-containing protein [Candidatus Sumerlaeaceae bacterium]
MPKFIVKQGAQPGQEVSFAGNRIVFGRADDCEVVVADANVSRHHAQAVILDGLVAVVDLNSSNGTYVNELPISRVFLMDGDEVRLGETILVFCDDSGMGRDFGAMAASSPRLRPVSNSGTMPALSTTALDELNRTQLFAPIPEDTHASALKEIYLKLKAVYRVFHEVAQAGSLKEMFEAVGRAVTISTGIERITFYLDSTKTGEPWQKLLAQTATRIDDKAASRNTSGALMQRARDEMKAVAAGVDVEGNTAFTGVEANAVAVPLLRGKQLMALIYADNPGTCAPISKNDMDFLATVALQLSIRLK